MMLFGLMLNPNKWLGPRLILAKLTEIQNSGFVVSRHPVCVCVCDEVGMQLLG